MMLEDKNIHYSEKQQLPSSHFSITEFTNRVRFQINKDQIIEKDNIDGNKIYTKQNNAKWIVKWVDEEDEYWVSEEKQGCLINFIEEHIKMFGNEF